MDNDFGKRRKVGRWQVKSFGTGQIPSGTGADAHTGGGRNHFCHIRRGVWCDDTDKTKIEVLKDGTFSETDVKAIGSYLSFAMEEQGTFRVTAQEKHSAVIWYAAGAGVVLLVVLLLLIKAARKRKKNKKSKMQEQEQSSGQSPEQNAEQGSK